MEENKKFTLRILRGSPGKQVWEDFTLTLRPFENVISALMEIQKNPINSKGDKVTPVVWEQGCLEEVCGSCSMLINNIPRQACSCLIEPLIKNTESSIIHLAPFTKFPLVRDLIVDRSIMFENLKKVHAWIETDGAYDQGFGPKIFPDAQEIRYNLSTCMTCGCCTESCPQVNDRSKFIGPQIMAQVRLFNSHPVGRTQAARRLLPLMDEGGIADCGNAQNCVRVCPKKIRLTDSIAVIGREVNLFALKNLFSFPDRDMMA